MPFGVDGDSAVGKALTYAGVAVGVTAVASLGVAYYHNRRVAAAEKRNKAARRAQRKLEKLKKSKASVEVTKQKLMTILKEVLAGMKTSISRVAEQEQSIRQRNPRATDESLMEFCKESFIKMMTQAETAIYRRNGVTEDAVRKAAAKFEGEADLKEVVSQMQKIADVFSPPQVDIPEDFTKEKLISFMTHMMDAMAAHVEKISTALKATPTGQSATPMQFAQTLAGLFQREAESITNALLKKEGLDQAVLQKAIQMYQSDGDFQQAIQTAQADQQRRFAAAGMM